MCVCVCVFAFAFLLAFAFVFAFLFAFAFLPIALERIGPARYFRECIFKFIEMKNSL